MGGLLQDWFRVTELEPGVFSINEPLHAENVHSWLVIGDREAALVDTGMGVGDIRDVVEAITDLPVQVINSHAHWDHVGGNWRFDRIAIHEAEVRDLQTGADNRVLRRWFGPDQLSGPLPHPVSAETIAILATNPTRVLEGGETIDLGGVALEVIHAPGHSPGGIVLLDRRRGILFSTDVAYASTLYITAPGSNLGQYCRTMTALADLAPSLRVLYPSHDDAAVDPAILPAMRDGLLEIRDGRTPDSTGGGYARHEFPQGFAVRLPG